AELPGAAAMASGGQPGPAAEAVPPADHGATVASPVVASGGQPGPAAEQPPAAARAATVATGDKPGPAAGRSSAQDAGGPSVRHEPPVTETAAAGVVAAAAPRMSVPG